MLMGLGCAGPLEGFAGTVVEQPSRQNAGSSPVMICLVFMFSPRSGSRVDGRCSGGPGPLGRVQRDAVFSTLSADEDEVKELRGGSARGREDLVRECHERPRGGSMVSAWTFPGCVTG